MMTSSNGSIFRVSGPLGGEFTGQRWIPHTKASDAELWCLIWSAPWINAWVNTCKVVDLRRHGAHYDVIVMILAAVARNNWHYFILIVCYHLATVCFFPMRFAYDVWIINICAARYQNVCIKYNDTLYKQCHANPFYLKSIFKWSILPLPLCPWVNKSAESLD